MKKRSISLLLSLVMMVSVIGSMIPAMAAEGDVVINDDYTTLAAGADLTKLGWTISEEELKQHGTFDGTGSSLKLQGDSGIVLGEGKNGWSMLVKKSLAHYDKDFAQSGTNEETRTAVRSEHLKGKYDIELTMKYGDAKSGNGIWLDVMGQVQRGAATDPPVSYGVGRLKMVDGSVIVSASPSETIYNSTLSSDTKVRMSMDTNAKTFQVFLDDNVLADGKKFPMSSWTASNTIYYIDHFETFADAPSTWAEFKNFKITEVEKDTNNAVEQAVAGLTIGTLTANPENVTSAIILPTAVLGADGLDAITWESSNPDVISNNGRTVTQQDTDTDVILTAKFTETATGFTKYKDFKLTVPAKGGNEESQWTQVVNMQLGSGESEYTVTQAGNANLEITSTTENYLQVKAKADGNYSAAGDQLKFEVPLKKDGQDFIMDSAKKYYFEVSVVDGMKTVAGKNAQLFASCAGKKANGTEDGTHSAFVFNSNSSKFNINKKKCG